MSEEYMGYVKGDIVYYNDEEAEDRAIGVILNIKPKKHEIVIDWVWADNMYDMRKDFLDFIDFFDLEPYCKKITEQEKLELILKWD